MEKFKNLGLSENILAALSKKGFEEPSPIQEKVIPILLNEAYDVIAQAQTGTGKTAAFGIPLIEKLIPNQGHVQTLILTPTRELALQVSEEINSLKGKSKLSITAIYGGQSIDEQFRRIKRGLDIIVGTPGRIIDHMTRNTLSFDKLSYLILDEADEMLNMGFIDDIEKILQQTNKDKKMLLFSATMPKRIIDISKKYMQLTKTITVKKEQLTTSLTDQIYFEVSERDKFEALCRIIDIEPEFYGLIFCRTKVDVDNVSSKLVDRSYAAEALHGDISQFQRERILRKFKSKQTNVLVATDVAARGIDVQNLTHVINYSLPQDPESYVHRIGRTGRAGKQGTAITFITPSEYKKLVFIQHIAKTDIRKEKIPEPKDIIAIKKENILSAISKIIENNEHTTYTKMSIDLLEKGTPEDVISALLKHAFSDELNESSYSKIAQVTRSRINDDGKTRLFIAKGRKKNFTARDIVEFLKEKGDLTDHEINEVRVFDEFSFATVPFEKAELLLALAKKESKGPRPIITKARDKNSSGNKSESRRPHSSRSPRFPRKR
ncbi:MAG: DEAD/DEAH box helicase [Candidatus Omnitrophica bacterium]|nr:DEAD/DEAH box helicase [Candidatus Omnitrophota bacterium]MDD5080684.1 DEAD/DEAH box helicase [Candidatus Omnitrophota bacterium]